jgi:hypothetical protein
MTSEFEELSLLWAHEPDAEEQRIFESLARTVSRRAKLIYYIELGLAFFLVIAVTAIVFLDPKPATLALVVLAIAALGWSSWKRYNLHQVEMIIDCSDREALIASALESAEARMRQSKLSFLLLVPSFFLGLALRGTTAGSFGLFVHTLWQSFVQPLTLVGAAAVFLLLLYFAREVLRLRRELRRLKGLQRQYREEAALDGDQ